MGWSAAVPAVEVADDPDAPGVGGPHREGGARARPGGSHRARAEHCPQALVAALAEQVQVELAEGGPEPVGVVDRDRWCRPGSATSRRYAALAGGAAGLEQAGGVRPPVHVAPPRSPSGGRRISLRRRAGRPGPRCRRRRRGGRGRGGGRRARRRASRAASAATGVGSVVISGRSTRRGPADGAATGMSHPVGPVGPLVGHLVDGLVELEAASSTAARASGSAGRRSPSPVAGSSPPGSAAVAAPPRPGQVRHDVVLARWRMATAGGVVRRSAACRRRP